MNWVSDIINRLSKPLPNIKDVFNAPETHKTIQDVVSFILNFDNWTKEHVGVQLGAGFTMFGNLLIWWLESLAAIVKWLISFL